MRLLIDDKKAKKTILTITLSLLIIFYNTPCSIFKYKIDDVIYFCGNEDWSAKDPAIMVKKATDKHYGYILFGWKSYLPAYPQAGINSEGLCFDWATVPSRNYVSIENKSNLGVNSTIDILMSCKNVDEVIKYINNYNFSHLAEEHLMFTDKSGKSCVFEYTNNKIQVIINNAQTQYITNFNLTDKEKGWYPCNRFEKLDNKLKQSSLKEADLKVVLDSVHQEGNNPTIYSYIFNLKRMEIKVFYNHNYNNYKLYTISKLLENNQLIDIYQ